MFFGDFYFIVIFIVIVVVFIIIGIGFWNIFFYLRVDCFGDYIFVWFFGFVRWFFDTFGSIIFIIIIVIFIFFRKF